MKLSSTLLTGALLCAPALASVAPQRQAQVDAEMARGGSSKVTQRSAMKNSTHWQFNPEYIKPACLATYSPWRSVGECQQYTKTLCKEIESCPVFAGFAGINERLAALEAALAKEKAERIAADDALRAALNAEAEARAEEDAAIRALLPAASTYEGSGGGTVSVGGGTIANVQTQVVAFPSAISNEAPNGVDQVSIFFTVTAAVDPSATISWSDLTNGEYAAPASAFVEGNGRVRCGVAMGYGGGSSAANQQPSLSTTNGFASYGLVDSNGVTLQSDQLPVVGNFDGVNDIWPLGQYSCTFLVARP